jgi:hypothetical protein
MSPNLNNIMQTGNPNLDHNNLLIKKPHPTPNNMQIGNSKYATIYTLENPTICKSGNWKPNPNPTICKLKSPKMQQFGHWKPNTN